MAKPINLQLGWPSKSLFPTEAIHAAASTVFTDPGLAGDALIYGPDPGYEPLRENLARWLTNFYKPAAGAVRANNVFIGNGASLTLDIVLGKFTDLTVTKAVFMVEPTYFLACPIFEDNGLEGKLFGVPEDEEGVDLDFLRSALEQREKEEGGKKTKVEAGRFKSVQKYPKLYRYIIYAVPTFSNPSAKVMSLRRRRGLLELAREFDALIITDDVYDMLRWPVDPNVDVKELPPPPPRLVDLDRDTPGQTEFGNAVSNGSLSKLVGPGVRVSWIEGTAAFTHTLSTQGAIKSGGSPGHMSSVFMNEMLKNGALDKHIAETLIPVYRKRYIVLMDAVKTHLEPLGVRVTTGQSYVHDDGSGQATVEEAGGFFTYLTLPDDLQPITKVAKIALDMYALKFAHGAMMVAAGDSSCLERAKTSFGRGVRLSWSWHDEDEIREGVERFAQILKDIRNDTVRQSPLVGGDNGTNSLQDMRNSSGRANELDLC